MDTSLETLMREATLLPIEQQLSLAETLMRRARAWQGTDGAQPRTLTDLRGAGKGLWKTAREVEEYLTTERNAWER